MAKDGSRKSREKRAGRPTIYDVARDAGLSAGTVSNVLRGVQTVSPENVEKVRSSIQALGYRRDVLAAHFRQGRRTLMGLIIPDFVNPFYSALVVACERAAERHGYRLVTVSNHENLAAEERHIEELIGIRAAGILIVPSSANLPAVAALRDDGMPTVVLDRVMPDCPFDSVGINNAATATCIARPFFEAGHRTLTVIATSLALPNMDARLAGVIAAAREYGATQGIEVVRCGLDLENASAALRHRFETGKPPKAILSLFIQGTLAALQQISRAGLAVPGDISIAGFDDVEWMRVMPVPISAVNQPIAALAETAVAMLDERIAGNDAPPRESRLECSLELRGSIRDVSRQD